MAQHDFCVVPHSTPPTHTMPKSYSAHHPCEVDGVEADHTELRLQQNFSMIFTSTHTPIKDLVC